MKNFIAKVEFHTHYPDGKPTNYSNFEYPTFTSSNFCTALARIQDYLEMNPETQGIPIASIQIINL